MDFYLALSYFDVKMGPQPFYCYPEEALNEAKLPYIANIMDQVVNEGFFSFHNEDYHTLNYYFEIDSPWARGSKESLMISTVFYDKPSMEIEKSILSLSIEFSDWIKSKNIFAAFYKNTSRYYEGSKEKIEDNIKFVETWIIELYKTIFEEIQEKIEREIIKAFMNQPNVLRALKTLIDEPKTLNELRTWYTRNFPESNFYQFMLKIMKYQLVYIPKFGKSEKPPFDIFVSENIKTITNLIILKNKLLNQFIDDRLINQLQEEQSEEDELEEKLEKIIPNK
jgi:hypothetical protein